MATNQYNRPSTLGQPETYLGWYRNLKKKEVDVQVTLSSGTGGDALFTLQPGQRIIAYAAYVDTAVAVTTATSLSVGSAADQDGVIDDTAVTSLDAAGDTLVGTPLAITGIASAATPILVYATNGSSTPTDGFTAGKVSFRFWIEQFDNFAAENTD